MIYPEKKQLLEQVTTHYDSLDPFYRQLWGEHLHHGYWITGNESIEQATTQLIELVAKKGQIDGKTHVLDVGCGYGATSRYLAKKYEAILTAVTVSKNQWQYARSHDPESTNPRYILEDFLRNTFHSASYDVVISIESSEHMVDKEKFFSEIFRLLKPGGRFVTCAWLSKDNPTPWEVKHLLEPICTEGRLPSLGSAKDYKKMMQEAGLTAIEFEDITDHVKKTWAICAYRATKAFFTDKQLRHYLLDKSSSERMFAKSLFRIWMAYNTKAMRYGLFCATKPT